MLNVERFRVPTTPISSQSTSVLKCARLFTPCLNILWLSQPTRTQAKPMALWIVVLLVGPLEPPSLWPSCFERIFHLGFSNTLLIFYRLGKRLIDSFSESCWISSEQLKSAKLLAFSGPRMQPARAVCVCAKAPKSKFRPMHLAQVPSLGSMNRLSSLGAWLKPVWVISTLHLLQLSTFTAILAQASAHWRGMRLRV